jgi:hypothetical protein
MQIRVEDLGHLDEVVHRGFPVVMVVPHGLVADLVATVHGQFAPEVPKGDAMDVSANMLEPLGGGNFRAGHASERRHAFLHAL